MTHKLEVYVSTNRVGSKVEDTLEVEIDDDATPEEIEAVKEDAVKEWMFNSIEWGWDDID